MLLSPDRRDWVAEGNLAHFVIQAVERLRRAASPSTTKAEATRNTPFT